MSEDNSWFLEQLYREADERAVAARGLRRGKRCSQCNGTGSVRRYVLPGVVAPDACKGCDGTGRRAAS